MSGGRTWRSLRLVPVIRLSGVGPARSRALADDLGIRTVEDLLHHYPRAYVDRTATAPLSQLPLGVEVTTMGTVLRTNKRSPRRNLSILEVVLTDERRTSALRLVFFNQDFRAAHFKAGTRVVVSGKVERFRGALQMNGPSYEVADGEGPPGPGGSLEVGGVVPQHPAAAKVSAPVLRRMMHEALGRAGEFEDPLPGDVLARRGLVGRTVAVNEIHFPPSGEALDRARARLVYEECLRLQIGLAVRRREVEAQRRGFEHDLAGELRRRFVAALPFPLTGAQERAIAEIESDLSRAVPMHRMLQGDVGAGKTVVAMVGLLVAVEGGHQGALMAPTEVLAEQHAITLQRWLEPLGVPVAVLTNRVSGSARERLQAGIAAGEVAVVVGTHALIQEGVRFADLAVAVVDEQHRFGVVQRAMLREKGVSPDVLIMTATPIPRTLAVTLYGDLDVSVLDEQPPGRLPVDTTALGDGPLARSRVESAIREAVGRGRRAFWICPLVEESEKLEVASVRARFEQLSGGTFTDLRVGLLHGQMAAREKAAQMDAFRSGDTDVLVATTVVEVGVDVPEATVMVVEDAHRFGLSQLHQLRGRVGRGPDQALCFLLHEGASPEALERLGAMERHNDGFALAEEDLRIRGQGTLFGEAQSGVSDLRITDLLRDLPTILDARADARDLVDGDPELARWPLLRAEVEDLFGDNLEWLSRG